MSPSSRRGSPPPDDARNQRRRPEPAPVDDEVAPIDEIDEADDEDVGGEFVPANGRPPFSRLGPGSGISYAVLSFIGSSLLQVGTVDPTSASDAIAREMVEQRGRVSGGILLTLFSLFFLTVFVSWLHHWLRDVAPRSDRWLATLSLVGGVLMVAMTSVVVVIAIGSTVLDDYGPDPVIARTLLTLQWQALAVVFVPTAAFVGATGVLAYTSRVLPRWLAYSGMVIGVGLLIPPLAFLPFLFSSLWIGMLGIVLLQRARFG